jgi:hypothetical protein
MLRILIALLLLLGPFAPSDAQFYFRGGYLVGSSPNQVLNGLIDRYNAARPWMGTKMPAMAVMHGPAASVGGRFGNFTMDITWKRLRQLNSAPEMDTLGNLVNRDLILRSDNFNYGLSTDLFVTEVVSFCGGLTVDFNLLSVLTQLTGQEKRTLGSTNGFGIGAQFPILVHFGAGIGIEMIPYVSYPFHKMDLYPTLQELDPANAANLPTDGYKQSFLNYGMSFYLRFGGFPE